MTSPPLDFGSLNDVLAKANPYRNVMGWLESDDEFRRQHPDVVNDLSKSERGGTVNLLRSAGPISDAYILGHEPVMLITGPGGSGKTTASCKKALVEAQRIRPGLDGVRRYVLGTWRQKYDNLWKATIPSWWKLFPRDLAGSKWTGASPRAAEHIIAFEDIWGQCLLTNRFRAFGDIADPDDLLGNEMTDAYLNEWSTLPEDLFTALVDRVGRDPPFEVIGRHGRFFGDSNAPDVLNYTYRDFYETLKDGYRLFRQPGGLDPGAENIEAMGRGYYENSIRVNSHRPWWIKRMVHARPGFTRDNDPVYPKYDDDRHLSRVPMKPMTNLPMVVGIDGGNTPAAAYTQEGPGGQGRTYAEVALERGGMRELANAMLALEAARFAGAEFVTVCDPAMCAGEEKNDLGDTVPMDDSRVSEGSDRQRLQKYLGRTVRPAKSQDVGTRIEAVSCKFDLSMDDGGPGYLLDPSCKHLRRGKNQTFHHRKIHGTNDRGSIAKTFDGHVSEAEQYAYLEFGSAEARRLLSQRRRDREQRRLEARKAGRYNPNHYASRRAAR